MKCQIMKLVLAEDSADLMRGNPTVRGFLIETGPMPMGQILMMKRATERFLEIGEVRLLMAIKLGFLMKNLEMNRIMAGDNDQMVENKVVKDTDTAEEKSLWTNKGGIPKRRKTAKGACKTVGMEKLITRCTINIGDFDECSSNHCL